MIEITPDDLLAPIGSIFAWAKSIGSLTLPDGFMECDGSTISDSESPLDGQTLPDLNGGNRFLRGHDTNNNTGGSTTHFHTVDTGGVVSDSSSGGSSNGEGQLYAGESYPTDASSHIPPYYDVVWVMRTK